MKRIIILTGDAGEALEILYVYQRMQEEGWEVDVASVSRKKLKTVIHDFEPGFDTYTEKPGYLVEATVVIADAKPEDYDGLVIPGGRAPEYLRNEPGVADWVRSFVESGKPVAAICHAGLLLAKAGVLSGKTCTAYPQIACDLEALGATFKDEEVVVDGNLITSRAWPDNPAWMREFIKAVKNTD